MILTLTASIMYWSLQQPAEESDTSPAPSSRGVSPVPSSRGVSPEPSVDEAPSPASTITQDESPLVRINGASSPAPSISGDEGGSIVSEISHLTIDDTVSDTVVSAQAEDPVSDTATSAVVEEAPVQSE